MKQPIERAVESAMPSPSAGREVEAVYAKIAKRIIPFLALLFVMAWLDRYNLGFAKLQMVKDLGFSEAVAGELIILRKPAPSECYSSGPRCAVASWSTQSSSS